MSINLHIIGIKKQKSTSITVTTILNLVMIVVYYMMSVAHLTQAHLINNNIV